MVYIIKFRIYIYGEGKYIISIIKFRTNIRLVMVLYDTHAHPMGPPILTTCHFNVTPTLRKNMVCITLQINTCKAMLTLHSFWLRT